jgi:ATP-dependent helicase/nuclease subunit A
LEQTKRTNNWTDEQKRAIEEEGCNLLVAAAAGAGKTAVLVERIIRKISRAEKPVEIDRLLVVTFTNAAAAEMRERIGAALSRVLEESRKNNSPNGENLQRQLALLGRASITTIHSFCLEVIRNYFHTIDIDPGFRIADETEALLLKMEALEELIESKYEPDNLTGEFLNLVECYGSSRDDRRLMDIVLRLYEFAQSHPWPELWLSEAAEAFNPQEGMDFGETKWAKVLIKNITIELSGLKSSLEEALKACINAEGLEKYTAVMEDELLRLKAMLNTCSSGSWNELYEQFKTLEFPTMRSGKNADPELKERVKAVRDNVKDSLRKIRDDLVNSSSEEMAEDLLTLYPSVKCLCGLAKDLGDIFAGKKKEKGIIDFNDLEHYCLKILVSRDEKGEIHPTAAALDLRERFEEIYIDEYQDSNLTQEVILNIISREEKGTPNIFMVGDVKQSIYRFRQAKPELFLKKYGTYSENTEGKYRKILLYKNFRSREDIINGANFIFKQIMSEIAGEIEYTDREALNLGAAFPDCEEDDASVGGAIELHIVETKEEEEKEEGKEENTVQAPEEEGEASVFEQQDEGSPDSIQSEAMLVAKRIKELVSGSSRHMVYDKGIGKYRPARFSDIVILLRTTKNWAEVFAEELSLQGIPTFTDTGSGYFKTIEVSTMLSLLQIIDNPMQDIPMLAVLRSPIEGFSPEQLIDIRLEDREASFYEALKSSAEEENELGRKARGFLDRLDKWREKSLYMSTDELIWYLYSDTGYYSFVGAMPGGVKRQANLRLIFDKARQYEESSFKGLFNFINFINKLKGSQGDMGSAKTIGEKEDVVRIMSIHKSKGLEFPIVFVCGTGKGFNLTDTTSSILLHHDLGIGPDFIDPVRRVWYPTVFKQALKYKIKQESLSEEMRILYVAFTRAKEKLIITGSVSDAARAVLRWRDRGGDTGEKVQEYSILKGKSYLDWIGMALMRHPEGLLAEAAGAAPSDKVCKDDSRWEIRIWNKEEVLKSKAVDADIASQTVEELGSSGSEEGKADKEVLKRLEWNYPYREAEKLPVKLTVSELKRHFGTEYAEEYYTGADGRSLQPEILELHKKPRFLEEERAAFTAAEKGSIMHFVMQHIDFGGPLDKEGIKRQMEDLVLRELLTEVQVQAVNIDKIRRLIDSDLGQRLLKAEKLYREVPFNLEIKCTEVFKDLPADIYENETTVLQGVIDCYFEEEGKLILVDYKTDYIPQGELDQLVEKYRIQLTYYARALEQITGKQVAEKYIYSFWADSAVKC